MKNNALKRRFLSICLAFVMLFSNIPATYASDVERYDQEGIERPSETNTYENGNVNENIQEAQETQVTQNIQEVSQQDGQEIAPEEQITAIPVTISATQTDEIQTLPGNMFDLQLGSVLIYDAETEGERYVEYGGTKYKTNEFDSFVFTGSTAENTASVMTDTNIEIRLQNLSMDADSALTFYGKGNVDIITDGEVSLNNTNTDIFLSESITANFLFEDKSILYAAGNIGATNDDITVTINGGLICAENIFTGGKIRINGGNIQGNVHNAVAGDDTPVYPVYLNDIASNTSYIPSITVNGAEYTYGWFYVANNFITCLYLPEGELDIVIDKLHYTGTNTKDGIILSPVQTSEITKAEEQQENVDTESNTENVTDTNTESVAEVVPEENTKTENQEEEIPLDTEATIESASILESIPTTTEETESTKTDVNEENTETESEVESVTSDAETLDETESTTESVESTESATESTTESVESTESTTESDVESVESDAEQTESVESTVESTEENPEESDSELTESTEENADENEITEETEDSNITDNEPVFSYENGEVVVSSDSILASAETGTYVGDVVVALQLNKDGDVDAESVDGVTDFAFPDGSILEDLYIENNQVIDADNNVYFETATAGDTTTVEITDVNTNYNTNTISVKTRSTLEPNTFLAGAIVMHGNAIEIETKDPTYSVEDETVAEENNLEVNKEYSEEELKSLIKGNIEVIETINPDIEENSDVNILTSALITNGDDEILLEPLEVTLPVQLLAAISYRTFYTDELTRDDSFRGSANSAKAFDKIADLTGLEKDSNYIDLGTVNFDVDGVVVSSDDAHRIYWNGDDEMMTAMALTKKGASISIDYPNCAYVLYKGVPHYFTVRLTWTTVDNHWFRFRTEYSGDDATRAGGLVQHRSAYYDTAAAAAAQDTSSQQFHGIRTSNPNHSNDVSYDSWLSDTSQWPFKIKGEMRIIIPASEPDGNEIKNNVKWQLHINDMDFQEYIAIKDDDIYSSFKGSELLEANAGKSADGMSGYTKFQGAKVQPEYGETQTTERTTIDKKAWVILDGLTASLFYGNDREGSNDRGAVIHADYVPVRYWLTTNSTVDQFGGLSKTTPVTVQIPVHSMHSTLRWDNNSNPFGITAAMRSSYQIRGWSHVRAQYLDHPASSHTNPGAVYGSSTGSIGEYIIHTRYQGNQETLINGLDLYLEVLDIKWEKDFIKKDVETPDGSAQQDASLDGATYELWEGMPNETGSTLLGTYTTVNGQIHVGPITKHTGESYYLKEVPPASPGYLVNPQIVPIDVSSVNGPLTILDPSIVTEQIKKNGYSIYKAAHIVNGGETGQTTIGDDGLKGAGFTVYEVSTLGNAYGISGFETYTDEQIVEVIKNNRLHDPNSGYEDVVRRRVKPATVYSDGTEYYNKYYGGSINSYKELNETTTDYGTNPFGTPILVKNYSYKRYKSDGTMEDVPQSQVSAGSAANEYIAAEFFTDDEGFGYMPMLPYGRYVLIETTTPYGYLSTDPVVFNIRDDANDGVTEGDGKGHELGMLTLEPLDDTPILARIRIAKRSTVDNSVVQSLGSQFIIENKEHNYVRWLASKSSVPVDQKQQFIDNYLDAYGDLVVYIPADGSPVVGTEDNPFTYITKENDDYIFQTPMLVPMGEYVVKEVGAPNKYVLYGNEANFRVDQTTGRTFWEVEDDQAAKWAKFNNKPTPNDKGQYVINEEMAGEDRLINDDKTIKISATEPQTYDVTTKEFYRSVNWEDDPTIGKISIYVEGEQLASVETGTTVVADRVESDFNGYTSYKRTINNVTYNSNNFKNKIFNWESLPVEGVQFIITAGEDIQSPDGTGVLFEKDQEIIRLTTDENGKAWTNTIETRNGTYKGLPLGLYNVTMVSPGENYAFAEEDKMRQVRIEYPGQTIPIVFKDEAYLLNRKKIEVAIGKYDAITGDAIDGAVFALISLHDIYAINDPTNQPSIHAEDIIALSETYNGKKATFEEEDLPLGEYKIIEYSAPIGYTTSDHRVLIGEDFSAVPEKEVYSYINTGYDADGNDYNFNNTPIGVYIRLSDYYTDVELANGKFNILDEEGNVVVANWITSNKGENIVTGLEVGKTYILQQIEAPEGYVNRTLFDSRALPETVKDYKGNTYHTYRLPLEEVGVNQIKFTVQDQNVYTPVQDQNSIQVVNVQNKPILGKIRIVKKGDMPSLDEHAGMDPHTHPNIDAIITSVGGKSIIEDVFQTIREKFPNLVNAINDANKRNITNEPIVYEQKGLAGAKYKIEVVGDIIYPDGETGLVFADKDVLKKYQGDEVFVTDVDGTIQARLIDGMIKKFDASENDPPIDGLLPGTYKITEIDSPRGYSLENGTERVVKYVTIDEDGVVKDATFINDTQKMDMQLIKTIKAEGESFEEPNAQSSGALSPGVYGATFVLIALEDIKVLNTYDNTELKLIGKGTVVDVKSTDKDGKIQWRDDLPIGNYAAFEVGVPKGYYPYKFGPVSYTTLDTPAKEMEYYDVVLYEGEHLKDDPSKKKIEIVADETNYGMIDDISVVKLFLRDIDNEHELADAKFVIKDTNGNPIGKTLIIKDNRMTTIDNDGGFITEVTDGTGHKIYGLEPGVTYIFEEVTPREDYTYTIYTKDENGNPVDTDGNVYTMDTLPRDKTDGNEFTYTVPTDVSVDTITLYNKRVIGEITLDKVGDVLMGVIDKNFEYQDMPLTGAKFSLYAKSQIAHPDGIVGIIYNEGDLVYQNVEIGENGRLIFTGPYENTEVNEDGEIVFGNLYMGTYIIQEIEFPDGFVIREDDEYELEDRTITISNRGPAAPIVEQNTIINNERQRVRINVEKIDAETKEIVTNSTGAEYRLYGAEDIRAADGAVLVYKDGQIGEPITLVNGKGTFTNPEYVPGTSPAADQYYLDLPLGHYYVEETKAPNGYTLPNYTQEELENRRLTRVSRRIYIDATYDEDGRREIVVTAPFENDKTYVTFDALDFNNHENRLNGTKFRITGEGLGENNQIEVEIGEKNGTTEVFGGVFRPGQTYTITELESVPGYDKDVYKKDRDVFTTPFADNPDGYSDSERWYKPVVTGAVLSAEKYEATFTVENVKGVQVITLFNKQKPLVTFDAMDWNNTTKHLFGTEIEISGGDIQELYGAQYKPITISEEGTNPVISLTLGETYTITEKKPVHGYGTDIYRIDGFKSPYEDNLNGYSDGSRHIKPVSSTDIIQNEGNVTKFKVEQRDGVQVITIFNTVITGTIKGVKEGEVATGYTMDGDNAKVTYAYQPLEGVTYELYADEEIKGSDGEHIYDENEKIAETTTDVEGQFSFTELPLGKYYVLEKSTLYGLVRSVEHHDADLDGVYTTAYENNNYNAEVSYTIPTIKNKRVRVDIGVPNTDGMDPIREGGDPMKNLEGKAGIYKYGISHADVDKTDANRNRVPLSGVEFTVYTNEEIRNLNGAIIFRENVAVAKATTDENGYAKFNVDLPLGKYYIKETGYKPGYTPLDTDTVYFDTDEMLANDDEHKIQILRYQFDMENIRSEVRVKLKDLNTHKELKGAQFKIVEVIDNNHDEPVSGLTYNNEEGRIVPLPEDGYTTWITNDTGTSIYGLTPGKQYKIIEEKPRENYSYNLYGEDGTPLGRHDKLNEYVFTVPETTDVYEIDLYNKFIIANLTFEKKTEQFIITDNGTGVRFNYTIDGVTRDIEFRLVADEDIYHPDGQSGQNEQEGGLIYHKGTEDIVRMKVNEFSDWQDAPEAVGFTNGEGLGHINGLFLGKYKLVEIASPEGYVGNEPIEITLDTTHISSYGDEEVLVTPEDAINNIYQRVDIKLNKKDSVSGAPVKDAEYTLYSYSTIVDANGHQLIAGQPIEVKKTDEDGNIHYTVDLPVGYMYYVQETKTPDGYLISDTKYAIDALYIPSNISTLEEKIEIEDDPVRLQINLMDVNTEVELEDAEITIYKEGTPVYTYHTLYNNNPILTPADVPLEEGATYTIKVTTPRPGYTNEIITKDDYSDTDKDVTLISDHTVAQFTIESTPEIQVINIFATPVQAIIRVYKDGNITKTQRHGDRLVASSYQIVGLPDAEYRIEPDGTIEHPDGHTQWNSEDFIQTLVTDENGNAVSEPMPLGKYIVTETKAPRGYIRDRKATEEPFSLVRNIDLREDYMTVQYAQEQYEIEVTDDHKAEFRNKMKIVDFGDDDDPLPDPEEDPTGDVYMLTGLLKVDDEGNPVKSKDAHFDLYTAEPIVLGGRVVIDEHVIVASGVSDEQGRVKFEFPNIDAQFGRVSLPVGKYYAVETDAPYGYYPLSEDVKVQYTTEPYENDDIVKIIRLSESVENIPTRVVLTVQDDRTYEYLDDVTFHIIDKETGETVVEEFTTTPGKTEYEFVGVFDPGHEYVVIEDKPRTEYTYILRDDQREPIHDPEAVNHYTFVVPETTTDGTKEDVPETVNINIYNEYVVGEITVTKTADELVQILSDGTFDYEQIPKDGIKFTLYSKGIKHPDGWTEKDGGRKIASDLIQGYLYELDEPIETKVTENGRVTFDNLLPGSYYILEEDDYEGYAHGTDERRRYDFEVHAIDYETQNVTARQADYTNDRQKVIIIVNKIDAETGELIKTSPAHFELRADGDIITYIHEPDTLIHDNDIVDEGDTDQGRIIFDKDLLLHYYKLIETQAPIGYVLDTTPISINATYVPTGEASFAVIQDVLNEQTKTVISVLDDEYHTQLADVHLKLYQETEDGWEWARDLVTGEDGTEILYGLQPGTRYKVVEEKPRFGYKNDAIVHPDYESDKYDDTGYDPITDLPLDKEDEVNVVYFTTENIGGLQVVTVFNRPVMTKFIATKKGELPVATYSDGGVVDKIEWIPDQGLDGATFILKAAEPIVYPDGYIDNATQKPRIMYAEGEIIETLTTGMMVFEENGQSKEVHGVVETQKPLYLGKYVLEEVHAPRGYSRDIETQNVESLHDLDLKKEYRTHLYELTEPEYNSDLSLNPEIESVADILTFENPRQGIDVGDGNPDGIEVTNSDGDPNQNLENHAGVYKYGIDLNGNEVPVDGAVFELRAAEQVLDTNGNVVFNENDLIDTAITGENGAQPGQAVFTTLLPVGKYKVNEVDAPHGYYSSSKEIIFDTAEYENNDHVQMIRFGGEIVNPVTTTIITLQDWVTETPLEDAVFKIIDPETGDTVTDIHGDPVVWKTDGTEHVVEGLDPEKEYVIVETVPREGYTYIIRDDDGNEIHNVKDDNDEPIVNEYAFTISDTEVDETLENTPEPYEIHLFNQYVTANIFVSKTGELIVGVKDDDFEYEDFGLQGAEFSIYAVDDIYHPDGKTGLIVRGGETFAVIVDTAGAHIARKDALVLNEDGTFGEDAIAITETDGVARFFDLFLGHYIIRETKTVPGYATNFEDKEFTVEYDNQSPGKQYEDKIFDGDDGYHNERQKISVTVIKHDKDDPSKGVADAVFGLFITETVYNARGEKLYDADPEDPTSWPILDLKTTDENGVATFTVDIPQAHYAIRELKAPVGYILNPEIVYVDATYKDDIYDATELQDLVYDFYDEETKTVIHVLDDDKQTNLADTHLSLYENDGSGWTLIRDDLVTDENGTEILWGLKPGVAYKVIEDIPRYGYKNEAILHPEYQSHEYDEYGYNPITELPLDKTGTNEVIFVLANEVGLQVVTIFNRPVMSSFIATKIGDLPVVTYSDGGVVDKIEWIPEQGLDGAEFVLKAMEDIYYPDGSGDIVYHRGDIVETFTTGKMLRLIDGQSTEYHGLVGSTQDLYLGNYLLEELKAPRGYSRDISEGRVEVLHDIMLKEQYEINLFDKGEYNEDLFLTPESETLKEKLTFENPRQGIDVGNDNPEGIEVTNPDGDPEQTLRNHAGVYKYGIDLNGNQVPVAGAVFELRAAEQILDTNGDVVMNVDDLIEIATTKDDGQAAFTTLLPVGKYKIREIDAPLGYYSSSKEVIFDTEEYEDNDHVQMIRFRDDIINPVTTTIVTLQDWVTETPLEDAIIKIVDPETGEVVNDVHGEPIIWTTDGTEHVIEGLDPEKEYILVEEKPREGYSYILRDDEGNEIHNVTNDEGPVVNEYAFTISDTDVNADLENTPEPYEIHLFNQYVTVNIFVSKTGELMVGLKEDGDFEYDDFGLQGAEFTIYVIDDIYHPDGKTGLIVRGGETFAVTVDTAGAHIARKNALVLNDDGTFGDDAIAITETDGIARFFDLFLGHYIIRETKTVPGYATNFEDKEFTVEYDSSSPEKQYEDRIFDGDDGYHNERQKIDITVIKHDYEFPSKVLADATFGLFITETVYNARGQKLYDADPNDPDSWPMVDVKTTGADGKAVFTVDIPQAHYVIRELKAPKGYILNPEIIDVDAAYKDDIYDSPAVQEYVFDFSDEQTKVIVDVLDEETNKIINNTHLVLKDENGNPVEGYEDIIVLDDDNHLIIRGLEIGKMYYFEEVKPAYGYSNEVFVQPDYESVYIKNGLHERYNGDFDEAHDLVDYKDGRNLVSFIVTDQHGLQVVTMFNQRVKATLRITKEGEMPIVTFTDDRDVEDITYEIKGLMGAEYDVYAAEDIGHPYGTDNLIYQKDEFIGHYVTDINGEIVLPNFYIGTYRVEETKAPKGYVRIQKDSFLIKIGDIKGAYDEYYADEELVDYAHTIEVTVPYENPRQIVDIGNDYTDIPDENLHGDPNYRLFKKTGVYKYTTDEGSDRGVANAQFTLYTEDPIYDNHGEEVIPANTRVETSWTDDNGRAIFTDFSLPVGKYYVVEDHAPGGYYDTSNRITFDTSEYDINDEVQVIRLSNVIENPPVVVKIFLRDVITDVELQDASLRVEDENGKYVASWLTTDTDGEGYVLHACVTPGVEYTITEAYPRDGYTNILRDKNGNPIGSGEPNIYKFKVDDYDGANGIPDEIIITLYNLHIAGYVRIHKSGEILTDYDELGFNYEEDAIEHVKFAVYAAEDIYYPDGETGPDGTRTKFSEGSQIPLFKKGELVRMNTHLNGGVDAIVETDLNGIALVEGLYPGKYEIREYGNVDGYAKPKWKGSVYFTIVPQDITTQHVEAREGLVEYTNKRQRVKIVITKLDTETKDPIEGVTFGLYASNDMYNTTNDFLLAHDEMIVSAVTDNEGHATFDCDIPAGHYYVKEIEAAEGYLKNDKVIEINATWRTDGRDVVEIKETVYNQKTKVRIIKRDENGEILGDTHLAIYDADGNKIKDFMTSEGCPFYTIEGLQPGVKYILKEEEPAPGYSSAKYICFRIKGYDENGNYEPQVVEMTDKPIEVNIRVIEDDPDYTGNRIEGVEFHIENMAGETVFIGGVKQEYVTNNLTDIHISKLPIGEYRIVVDSVPTGYIKPEITTINVIDSSDTQTFTIKVGYTDIEIAAVDKETGKVLQKVKADVMTDGGDIIIEDQSMAIRRKYIPTGDYLVHVTQGPSGYLPQSDDAKITVENISGLQKFQVELDHTRVRIVAVDQETGQRINGVKVDIKNKSDLFVAYDAPLDYYSDYMPSGEYTVATVRVPDQYMTPAVQTFYVRQTPDLQIFEIPMYRVRAAIRAVDVTTNKPVKGVKLKLRSRTGSVYSSWTTKKTWKLFRPIMPGTYMLEVVSVPSGFEFPKSKKILVESLPDIQYFEVELTRKQTPSGGGGGGTHSITSAGSSSSSSGSAAAAAATGKSAIGSPMTGDTLNLIWLFFALAIEGILAGILFSRRRRRL